VHTCNNYLSVLYVVLEELSCTEESTPTQESTCPEKPQQIQTSGQLCEKEDISSPPLAVSVECKAQPQGQQLQPAPKLTTPQPKYLQATSQPVIDYTLKVESVRHYQRELAQPGIKGQNYIVCAPTGTGKTLVAGLIISDHLQRRRNFEKKVFFVVPTRPLAEQQAGELQRLIPGSKVVSSIGDDAGMTIKDVLPCNDTIVCTAGKLVNEIKYRLVTFNDLGLLVLDECHHARKNAPHAKLMEQYLERKKESGAADLPQVVGLTASPGAGDNPSLNKGKTIDHLISLCALMDATSGITVVRRNLGELHQFTTKPTVTLKILNQRDPGEEFIQIIADEMTKLEGQVDLKASHKKWSQEYESCVQREKLSLEESLNPALRDPIRMLALLRCYSQALSIYMDLRNKDAISTLSEFTGLPDDEKADQSEKQLKQSLGKLVDKLRQLPPVQNPLLQQVKEILYNQFKRSPNSKGILFVHTKKHASSMCDWISALPIATSLHIQPRIITGHTRETGHGMTQDEQEEVMESFRKGECNLLVATSVAEEGLDVPACNLVIRFQHVSNEIARTQTQGRARAAESDCFTILSGDTRKPYQEIKNGGLQALVDEVLQNQFPTGQIFQEVFLRRQQEIIHDYELRRSLKLSKQKTRSRKDVQLSCKMCKAFACYGSDIYTVENATHHIVPDEEFKANKIKIKPHPSPKQMTKMMKKTHKIYCRNCDADWGIMCKWPKEGHEFPVLKCVSFNFETSPGNQDPIKKWSDVPFDILPLSAYLDSQ